MPAARAIVAALSVALLGGPSLHGDERPFPLQRPARPSSVAQFPTYSLFTHERVLALFDLYDRHEYDEFDRRLTALAHLSPNWVTLEADAEAWVAAAPSPERRRLVAASVAMEVAVLQPSSWATNRLAIELGCRLLLNQPPTEAERDWHRAVVALSRLHHDVGVLSPPPSQRAPSIIQTLIPDVTAAQTTSSEQGPTGSRGSVPRRPLNEVGEWLDHSRHIAMRFPDEASPALAMALAVETRIDGPETLFVAHNVPEWMDAASVDRIAVAGRKEILAIPTTRRMDRASADKLLLLVPELANNTAPFGFGGRRGPERSAALMSRLLWQAVDAYERLVQRDDVGSEAYLHLGQTYVRLAQPGQALNAFTRAAKTAKTPYETYLALTLAGALLERVGKREDAIVTLLAALQAVPRAQSATLALAPLLFETGQRDRAADLLEDAVRLPVVTDPLQYYWQGDPEAPWRALRQLRQALK
jgi:tetratricopeptide (TPR) repeat protein